MNQDFEQSIPIPALIAGFVLLLVVSTAIRRTLRKRQLSNQGQIETSNGRIPSLEERVAGNADWAKGEIYSAGQSTLLVVWFIVLFSDILIFGGLLHAVPNPEVKTAPMIVLGVFGLLAAVFSVFAVRLTVKYLRYGRSLCRIEGKAGVLGKRISGSISTQKPVDATGDYCIQLQCVESYSTGTGKNRRTETKVHFETKQLVPHLGRNSTLGISFSFDLPKYPPETAYQLARGTVSWQLMISAPVKGVDYTARFVVPVFKMDYSE